jgi:hypothetical protein
VVIHTWDGYRRFWGPALHYGRLNLPEGIPRFFVSEEKAVDEQGFRPLLTGTGSFVDRLLTAARELEEMQFRYLFYLQEDHWLTRPLPASLLNELVDVMESEQLMTLKLGRASFWPTDIDKIRRECGLLGTEGWPGKFRWFGPHYYGMSHHVCLFRLSFLIESLEVAALCEQTRPLQHEILVSEHLMPRMKQFSEDDKPYRIAVWDEAPVVEYVHAGNLGNLTPEAVSLLEKDEVAELYRPDLPGEVFPSSR